MSVIKLFQQHNKKRVLEIVNTPIFSNRYSSVEILDSENIKSNIEKWKLECAKFKLWCEKIGINTKDSLSMAKAYHKIEV